MKMGRYSRLFLVLPQQTQHHFRRTAHLCSCSRNHIFAKRVKRRSLTCVNFILPLLFWFSSARHNRFFNNSQHLWKQPIEWHFRGTHGRIPVPYQPAPKILALPLSVERCWAPGKANYWENDKNSHKKSIMPVSDKNFFLPCIAKSISWVFWPWAYPFVKTEMTIFA